MSLDLGEALQTFFAESRSLLQEMEEGLLRLETTPDDAEAINAVFRAAHTIKGSSGLFGLDTIVAFTHKAENVLDRVRNNELPLSEELVGLLLACRDHIERLVDIASDTAEMDGDTREQGESLASRLSACLGEMVAALPAEVSSVKSLGGGQIADDTWHISLRFGQDVLKNGMDPLSFIRYLATLGEIVHLVTLADALPAAAEMDPESCYLGFEIRFKSDADKARIENVFEFVRDDCALHILPPGSRVADYMSLIEALPEDNVRLGELLVACGALTQRELEEALAIQGCESVRRDSTQPLGQILVDREIVQAELVDAALLKQKDVRQRQTQEAKFVRVHADKLDSLINLVGELVIAGAGVGLIAARNRDGALLESVSGMARLVEEIRDGAMRLRMVEIGETFNRFRRVVRDVSKEIGKDIELVTSGTETELDKTVVEKIGDPLTHLVRNAMDHGIESADVRLARGKPVQGTLRLNAHHEAGGIVIEVSDDGGGLNRARILAKARDKGLIQDGDTLTDRDVWNLIFEPGFSTAEQVSNLSGRGVGMDVVRRNIEALRGTVEIESREGVGSTFRIRLPLTLAIIDGFLMGVAGSHYVVPLDMVLECVELSGCGEHDAGCDYLNLRGEVLPLLRVKQHFDLEGRSSRRQNVVVVTAAGRKAGLVVDELKGELQAVIKPLGNLFERIRGISGSTILGSGEVALVLDVPTLMNEAARVGSPGVEV
ncbi:chemotaxis protein CheA [Thiobacillus sp.]|uniref:chemotaxis protein CheA n=1 Tax=Thiobacillus sp. TaxID=924 RepID=UPI0017AEBFF7|nr:chemotaxis protein CheA [Thiobacillus sp.]MBC2731913.1 chemotaxis protein CheA [Thiobacillus sp.]MBC2740651.1 chemotaxis protein CheA [Thiobacillus sp.]MBC2758496.1 chemotaxis protein CheA [Thiobacillus sp.]